VPFEAYVHTLRDILNFVPGPSGELCPLGGMFTPSFTPRGEHSLFFKELRGKQIISPRGNNFTPGGQLHPWGTTSPLGVKVCPYIGEKLRMGLRTLCTYFIWLYKPILAGANTLITSQFLHITIAIITQKTYTPW
jgi:hypothetical protein